MPLVIAHTKSTGQLSPEPQPHQFLTVGVNRSRGEGLCIIPTVLSVSCSQEITVLALCPDSPCFLPRGLTIAQDFLLPESWSNTSLIAWTSHISWGWLQLSCVLKHLGKAITLIGLIDTGADITLIWKSKWSQDWTIIPSLDQLAAIGGHCESYRSLHFVIFEGPQGRVATTKPFIVGADMVLWGRDILSQWGLRILTKAADGRNTLKVTWTF